jgi:hypothetical protein
MNCSGCFPEYQPNQQAHMEQGGCLWCDYADENLQLQFEGELASLFDENPVILETEESSVRRNLDPFFEKEESVSEATISSSDNTECCICFENINKNKNNCVTECGHIFCLKCLMTSFAHDNTSCPCCRQELIDPPEDKNDEDDDEEYITDEDDDEDEDEDDEAECPVEEIAERLIANGYTLQSVLSLLLGRYPKGESDLAIFELNKKFDIILDEADNEALEQNAMGMEDIRILM